MIFDEFVQKVLLDNAIKHGGKARPQAVVGAVLREFPEHRANTKKLLAQITKLADEINALTDAQQKKMLKRFGGSGAPKKEVKDPFALGHSSPVLRFEPSPSGPLHIGHAYPLALNHLLAARNNGKLILRIGDTNPDNIAEEAYSLIEQDAQWLTKNGVAEVYIQSDRMELYYQYAEHMIAKGWAYVDIADPEESRKLLAKKQAPPDRDAPPAVHLERWELMKTTYKPGDAVVRIKTEIDHKNPAMRDWPALRINTSPHVRQGTKYRIWPLMNFSVSVDDIEMGVTHVLRAKDHADNAKRQEYMYRYFEKPIPVVYNVGKINFTDLRLKTSEVRKQLLEGKYTGWDDIRLPFLQALARRGFCPDAFLRLAEEMGISATDKSISKKEYFTNIEGFNRDFVDAFADRAFFVQNPMQIRIVDAPLTAIERDLHPTVKQGGRKLEIDGSVLVSSDELEEDSHILYRLIDGFNFKYKEGEWVFVSESYEDFKQAKRKRIIHYLPAQHPTVPVRVTLPDGSYIDGVAEAHVQYYKQGALLQFERFGFVRMDDASQGIFWFTHK